ncbi:uncharacterized protein [Antedon mediterranea]|uniref:uncharacterized protein n=1 Tax=Antedon mediterranea TaxID=105859 RepID=UPI003AF4E228
MVIILSRFSIFYESQLLRTQFGFRSNTGCNDAIYVIKQIQEIAYRSNRKLYTCFIDLTAAFDHLQIVLKDVKHRLRGIYDDFESGYADDFAVSSWSQEELQTIVNILNEVCLEFGLRISAPKRETIIWNWKEEVEEYPRCIIQIGGVHINNVTHFRYLGVWATYNDVHIGDQEVKYRINSAKGAFTDNRALLTNRTILLQTRMMFLNGLVRSRLTYGCHAWRATGSEMSKLSTTYKTFLRRMLVSGFQRVCPPNHVDISSDEETDENYIDWRYVIDNDDLYKITGCQPLEEYVYKQQFNWIGHRGFFFAIIAIFDQV